MKPYEADASRVRAMYRLLAPCSGTRTMEVCSDAPAMLAAPDWRGEHVAWSLLAPMRQSAAGDEGAGPSVANSRWHTTMPEGPFDLIVVHRTLDRLAAAYPAMRDRAALEALFRTLAQRLVRGGILVVTVANGGWLAQVRMARRDGESSGTRAGARLSSRRLRRLFAAAGLVQLQSYNVLPDADAPLRLVDTDADLSRLGFRRELAFMQSSLPRASYLLRRVVAELALNRHFEDWVLVMGARQ